MRREGHEEDTPMKARYTYAVTVAVAAVIATAMASALWEMVARWNWFWIGTTTRCSILVASFVMVLTLATSCWPPPMLPIYSKTQRSPAKRLVSRSFDASCCTTDTESSSSLGEEDDSVNGRSAIDSAAARTSQDRHMFQVEVTDLTTGLKVAPQESLYQESTCTSTQEEQLLMKDNDNDDLPRYVKGKILHPDGSPAYVPAGAVACEIPDNFVQFNHGNVARAKKQWEEHQQFRKDHNVWQVHVINDPNFDEIKRAYPHVCHGRSKQGWAVMYEHPGRMDINTMFYSHITNEDILHHDLFVLEYVANVLSQPCEHASWGMMGVLDLRGAKVSQFLNRDVLRYLQMISKVNDDQYPMHVKKVIMVHAPHWMANIFRFLKPMLPPSLAVDIVSSENTLPALREYIDEDQLPKKYGGTCPYEFGQHPMELNLVKIAHEGPEGAIIAQQGTSDSVSDILIAPTITNSSETVESSQQTQSPGTATYANTRMLSIPESTTSVQNTSPTTSPQPRRRVATWPFTTFRPPSCLVTENSDDDYDDDEDDNSNSNCSPNVATSPQVHYARGSLRTVRGRGPLRPRLASFEPVRVPGDTDDRESDLSDAAYQDHDDQEYKTDQRQIAVEDVVTCDIFASLWLAACG